MGIFKKLGAAFGIGSQQVASPWRDSDILERITAEMLWGDVSEISPLGRDGAMRVPVIDKLRGVAVATIARLPLEASRQAGPWPTGTFPLLEQPTPGTPLSSTLVWTIDSLIFNPSAFWHITRRDSHNWPVQARFVPLADAEINEDGELVAAFGQKITPGDFIRFDGQDEGLLSKGADTLRRYRILERVAALAEANPVPSIELHNAGEDLTDEAIDKLIERWANRRKKSNVAYTSKSLEVNTHGQQPEQLLIDARKRLDLDLTRHMGAPAWAADVPVEGASLNYQNRASRNWELLDLFASRFMTVIEDRLSLSDVTPRGTTVKFNTDELTRPDEKARFDTYKVGIDGGFITNEWIAKREGWAIPA